MGTLWSATEFPPFVGMPPLMSMDALLLEIGHEHLRPLFAGHSLDRCSVEALQGLGVGQDEQQAVLNAYSKAAAEGRLRLSSVAAPQIWLTSDVHTDHFENLAWLRGLLSHGDDAVIVAGDISNDIEVLEKSLLAFKERFGAVFYIPGNHEAWVGDTDTHASSLEKFEEVRQLCQKLGVHTSPQLVGDIWIVPLHSWYDLSLDLIEHVPSLAHLSDRLENWADFGLCKWPSDMEQSADFSWSGQYPCGVSEHLVKSNEMAVNAVHAALKSGLGKYVVSFSHFLPCIQTLPDWMDPEAEVFDPKWLDHPAASLAMKFSRVAGSQLIDVQLRGITADVPVKHHIHAFGHSHRPKDFVLKGVRYVNNPVASPKERRRCQVQPIPRLKLLWTSSGPVASTQILRYWEENGGIVG